MAPRSTPPRRLRSYAKKRDFSVTREPPPARAPPRAAGALTFMVHKHHARRLHYDLRLEMDGVLASWAVPKGPSEDPADRRLAVQTEDHPLEYGGFEGRIPDGEYGGGDSLIWDRGTYDTEPPGQASAQRERGHLVLQLDGEKLKGRWHLVRTGPARPTKTAHGKAQWLLFKGKDAHARTDRDLAAARPESVVSGRRVTRGPESARVIARGADRRPADLLARAPAPMLATLVSAPPAEEAAWILEQKYDGYRALAAIAGGRAALSSRGGLDLSERFPRVTGALAEVQVAEALLDGEICALDAAGRPRFSLVQRAGGARQIYYAFDLLRLDGEDLSGRPLEERRELLESVLGNAPPGVELAAREAGPADRALARVAKAGLEGLIAKRRGSVYTPGRSRDWLKLKARLAQEVTIAGYLPLTGRRDAVGALLVAVAEGRGLRFAGKVGTGFTASARRELAAQLAPDRIDAPAVRDAPRVKGAVWVEPRHVAQVALTEWTSDGKMRHPSFQGLRLDKRPSETAREAPAPPPADGARVSLTHPDRVLYPEDGITKRQVADHAIAMAEPLLRALAGRPLALEHWPKGLAGKPWFQQDVARDAQPWMEVVDTPAGGGKKTVRHLVATGLDALLWMAQTAVLGIHMWSSRRGSLESPDWVVFDLDPADGHGIEQAIDPARTLHGLLDELKLPSVVKTSGKRGLHVLVPLARGHDHAQATDFARRVAAAIADRHPEVTVERARAKRRGRLYLDWLQNGQGKTIVAPYSLRAAPGAPVSAPLAWEEVTRRLDPGRFNLRTMPRRLARVGDLFAPALAGEARLPRLS